MEAAQPSQAGVVAAAEMERRERPFQGQVTGLGAGGTGIVRTEHRGTGGGAAPMEMEQLGSEA